MFSFPIVPLLSCEIPFVVVVFFCFAFPDWTKNKRIMGQLVASRDISDGDWIFEGSNVNPLTSGGNSYENFSLISSLLFPKK